MNYVIEYELVAFIALVIVSLKYFFSTYFPSTQNRIFGYLLLVTLLTLLFDIITAYTLSYVDSFPFWLNQLLNTLYFSFQTINPPIFLIYILSLLGYLSILKSKRILLIFIPAIINLLLLFIINPFTELFFFIHSIDGYSYGPWFYLLHIVALIYLLISLIFSIRFRDKLSRVQFRTILGFVFSILITMYLQARFPRYLITGVILSFGSIIMYFTLQNPQHMKDVLTGCFNYSALLEYLSELIKSKQRFHLIAVNINDFSRINRIFGLKNGNQILINLCEYISNLEDDIWVFRMKGTRFVIITENDSSYTTLKTMLENRIDSSWDVGLNQIFVSISICSMFELNHYVKTIDDVVNFIETSFIQSEVNGIKKKIISSDEGLYNQIARMMAVESALRKALDTNLGFELNFQPIYSFKERKFKSAETLLRLNDSILGSISPSEFVPIAEKNGLVLQMDLLVVEKVCQFIAHYNPKESLGLDYLSINLSAAEFMNRQMPKQMTELLNQYQIDPNFIVFEITETIATVSYDIVSACMQEYRTRGFRFALDDFGTGYANLSQVVSLPFSIVKIDRGLLFGSRIVLEDLLHMFKRLGLTNIIEGVETIEQSEFIKEMEVDYIQGYLYANPLNESSFIYFLELNQFSSKEYESTLIEH